MTLVHLLERHSTMKSTYALPTNFRKEFRLWGNVTSTTANQVKRK